MSVVLMAGCSSGSGTNSAAQRDGTPAQVFTGHLESLHPGSLTPTDLGSDDQAFGLQLLTDVCAGNPEQSTVLSPASVTQALGMLQTGATGATSTALSRLLHQPAYGPAVIAAQHQRTAELKNITGLSTSNRVFTQTGSTPQQATLNDLQTAYAGQLRTLDFANQPEQATRTVNHLVAGDTHGLIPTLFAQPLDPSTVTVLTNAIDLKARWQIPFQSPVPSTFTTARGEHITVPTLRSQEADPSAAAAGWQSVQLPYDDPQLTAYALLPPVGAMTCTEPDAATLAALLHTGRDAVDVTMPTFHLTQTRQLLTTLTHEGLQPNGNYDGISPGGHVTQVVQEVDISVDKNGTTAAAATGIGVSSSATISTGHVSFNRPFLFLVTDTATHTPLFLTRIADPRG